MAFVRKDRIHLHAGATGLGMGLQSAANCPEAISRCRRAGGTERLGYNDCGFVCPGTPDRITRYIPVGSSLAAGGWPIVAMLAEANINSAPACDVQRVTSGGESSCVTLV